MRYTRFTVYITLPSKYLWTQPVNLWAFREFSNLKLSHSMRSWGLRAARRTRALLGSSKRLEARASQGPTGEWSANITDWLELRPLHPWEAKKSTWTKVNSNHFAFRNLDQSIAFRTWYQYFDFCIYYLDYLTICLDLFGMLGTSTTRHIKAP